MTDARRTSYGRVAHWRLAPEFWDRDVQVRVPCLNPKGSLIWPPLPGELPGYEILIENEKSEKQEFKDWVFTLSVEDQEKIRANIRLERA